MTCRMVCRISAVAELDDRPAAVTATRERAAAGDGENVWLLEERDAGRLLLAQGVGPGDAADGEGREVMVRPAIDGVWLERDEPPRVEEQVAGVAPARLDELA